MMICEYDDNDGVVTVSGVVTAFCGGRWSW